MTSFFAWNMRGFNKPRKHTAVKKWLQLVKPVFGCLLETRVQEGNHLPIHNSCFPGWQVITNYDHHRLGRIWFCFSDAVHVTLLFKSAQTITCGIQVVASGETFICSAVYASNFAAERLTLWNDLRDIESAYASQSLPWILIGDYNEILSSQEHSRNLDYLPNQAGMRQFQAVVTSCGLTDLPFVGPTFTWWNKQGGDPIGKKLDRALVNSEWLSHFRQSFATFDAGGVSDHSRCLIRLTVETNSNKRPFQFFNFLASHEQFLPLVAQVWDTTPPLFHSRAALHLFHRKLKLLKPHLRALNRTKFGDLPLRTKQTYEELCTCQELALNNPSLATFQAAASASDRWHHLAHIEEQFYHQKSRIQWLQLGDQNSGFFHRAAQDRAARSAIRSLTTTTGEVLTDTVAIKHEAVTYFQQLLQNVPLEQAPSQAIDLPALIQYRCSSQEVTSLIAPVTAAEIKQVVLSMPANKAPGPDGFTVEFYKAAWPIIGSEFIVAVQSFFLYGFLPRGINATILSLVPKHETAQQMKDFRPIA